MNILGKCNARKTNFDILEYRMKMNSSIEKNVKILNPMASESQIVPKKQVGHVLRDTLYHQKYMLLMICISPIWLVFVSFQQESHGTSLYFSKIIQHTFTHYNRN